MALLHKSFFRLSISNVFLPYKTFVYNRLSTSAPLCKVTVEEKLGIKPRPKRPKSSFLRFLSQIKPQILQDNPKASITEINRIAGERWRVADEKIKTDLSDEFKADWSKYLEQVKTYERALSPIQKEEIQKANETVSVNKKKKKLRQQMEQLGKPKRPASTFVMFMLTKVQERGDTPFKEWQQKVTKEWETTSVAVKDQLNETYQKEMENYRQELEKWERKMQREGHKELVRRTRSS